MGIFVFWGGGGEVSFSCRDRCTRRAGLIICNSHARARLRCHSRGGRVGGFYRDYLFLCSSARPTLWFWRDAHHDAQQRCLLYRDFVSNVDVEVLRNTPYFLEPGELHSKERSHLYVGTRGHASEQILILYSEREMPSKLLNGDVLQVPAIPGSKVLVLHNGGATCNAAIFGAFESVYLNFTPMKTTGLPHVYKSMIARQTTPPFLAHISSRQHTNVPLTPLTSKLSITRQRVLSPIRTKRMYSLLRECKTQFESLATPRAYPARAPSRHE